MDGGGRLGDDRLRRLRCRRGRPCVCGGLGLLRSGRARGSGHRRDGGLALPAVYPLRLAVLPLGLLPLLHDLGLHRVRARVRG